MTEQEAFEEWWNNRLSSMEYRTGKGWANIFWQAACKWQRAMIYDFVGRDFAHLEPQEALLQHQSSCLQKEREVSNNLMEQLAVAMARYRLKVKECEELSAERAVSDKLLETLRNTYKMLPAFERDKCMFVIVEVEAIRAKQAERKD